MLNYHQKKTKKNYEKTQVISYRNPCPNPKCRSSDAFHIYSDGHGYCYSCEYFEPEVSQEYFDKYNIELEDKHAQYLPITNNLQRMPETNTDSKFTYQYVSQRGLTTDTLAHYGVLTKVDDTGAPVSVAFPYSDSALKVRDFKEKKFYSVGDMKNATLFGKDKFSKGSYKAITITEGEYDALSVYQMLGSTYPVLSVRSASSAEADCNAEWKYLNSFEKIYLCFDNDGPGKSAKAAVARLFDFNKVYDVELSEFKDANAYLTAHKEKEFKQIWWNAKRFLPEGIISSFHEFDNIIDEDKDIESVPFPFPTVQELTYGIRLGEIVLFTALEGIGKTEILRAIEYHLLKETESNIGIIHLEESKERFLKGLAGYELKQPVHLPDTSVTKTDIKEALHSLIKREDRLHIYTHFGSDDPSVILDIIRFMVASCNCRYIFFDHISMAVSGLREDDERKALDFLSTRLAMMVKELNFGLILVSHVNDQGQTRGSRNISKIADCWIHLERDKQAPTEEQRNTTYLTFNKNRFGARTGPGGELNFDLSTFIISETDTRDIGLPPVKE